MKGEGRESETHREPERAEAGDEGGGEGGGARGARSEPRGRIPRDRRPVSRPSVTPSPPGEMTTTAPATADRAKA